MRPLRTWLIYLAVVLLGGALLAPWLYVVVQWAAAHVPILETVARNPFHRFVNRSALFLALIGLWPLLRHLQIKSWSEVGLTKLTGEAPRLVGGFLLGFCSLGIAAGVAVLAGARQANLEHTQLEVLRRVLNAALAAVCVSVLEETLFRGALFGTLRKAYRWPTALAVSSIIYAAVHFLAPVRWGGEVNWLAGLVTLGQMCQGLFDPNSLLPAFLNLALAGALLGLAYQRTGTLYFSIGLHAGWVFWLKSYGFLTRAASNGTSSLWGTARLTDGWFTLIVMVAILVLVWRLTRPVRSPLAP
jgi:membrane protease YdiL (CAAX protease family)